MQLNVGARVEALRRTKIGLTSGTYVPDPPRPMT